MRKAIAVLAVLATLALPALAQTAVYSANAVGFVKISVPPGGNFALVGLNFEAVGGGDMTLMDLFGTNSLRSAPVPQNADKVLLYNVDEQRYYTYAFKQADSSFHEISPVNQWNGASSNPSIRAGEGFWIQSAKNSTETNVVTLLGQVISADEVEFSIVPGLQLLGCPFTAWVDLAQEDWVGQGARAAAVPQLADQLTFFVDGAYQSYALKQADGKWHMVSPINQWMGAAAANLPVDIGVGLWYFARSSFTWVVSKPYLWP